jgi:hypothetical protein
MGNLIDATIEALTKPAPACKTDRGYDTNVKREFLNPDDNETHRTVFVKCTRHNITAKKRFQTAGMTGSQIAKVQKTAFAQCFGVVERECHNA